MKERQIPDNCIRICIDEQTVDRFAGRLVGIALEEAIPFDGIGEFIIKVDEAFNRIGKSQSSQIIRSFKAGKDAPRSYCGTPQHFYQSSEILDMCGQVKTIDLIMMTRKHAEWQGVLKSADGDLIGEFQSVTECLTQL
ncbi:hypothetical protein [Eubacterium aggregans]|uniref:hypothetical protein n=1 Tax=Eubacterium aggregans TaxID=81409 RepID=UPI003F303506